LPASRPSRNITPEHAWSSFLTAAQADVPADRPQARPKHGGECQMRRSIFVASLAGLLWLLATPAGAGTILTAGEYAPRGGNVADGRALFATDTHTGASSILSDFRDPSQGPLGTRPVDVAVTGRGRILVLDHDGSVPGTAGVVRAGDARC
jgi:hypothetical protein